MTIHKGIDRRALLQRALLLVGATAVPGGFDAFAATAADGQRYLAPAQFALLTAVADTLVPKTDSPGAVEVGVPAAFDQLLVKWAGEQSRHQLIAALASIDQLGRIADGVSFAALAPARRTELLATHDAASLKPVPVTGPAKPLATRNPLAAVVDPAYARLKELIVTLYYLSEPALTQELSYEHSPGEWRPSIPITPETRAAGGIGLI